MKVYNPKWLKLHREMWQAWIELHAFLDKWPEPVLSVPINLDYWNWYNRKEEHFTSICFQKADSFYESKLKPIEI